MFTLLPSKAQSRCLWKFDGGWIFYYNPKNMFWQILLFDQQQQQTLIVIAFKLMDTKLDYIDQSKQQSQCLCWFDGGWIFSGIPKHVFTGIVIQSIKHHNSSF